MSWNEHLFRYHQKYGGSFWGGTEDDGLLVLTCGDQPLAVDLKLTSGAKGGSLSYVRARIPVTLAKPYKLTIGAAGKLSGGVNAVLGLLDRGLPGAPGLSADYGCPEVTKNRLIRTGNRPFTKLVLGSLELRGALLACPKEKVEVRPGPGENGLHLITVTTAEAVSSLNDSGSWYLWPDFTGEEDQSQRIQTEFFPRMDGFLALARAAYHAVTQWPM